jgi:NAD+ kinase
MTDDRRPFLSVIGPRSSVIGVRMNPETFRRVGIIVKSHRSEAEGVVRELIAWLRARECQVILDTETAALVGEETFGIEKVDVPHAADLIVVIGGDGTILSVARLVGSKGVPILGVNLGGLGFLTEITLDELYPVLGMVLQGEYRATQRMLLDVTVYRQGERAAEYLVFNDAVINKGALARIVELEVYIDDEYVTSYRADGLIVSTPTGSTAYCLSAGGPILFPTMQALVVIPICPHTLTNRPLVLPERVRVQIVLNSEKEDVYLTLDGQVGFALRYQDRVEIHRSEKEITLIASPKKSFYQILRTKLKWGER